MNDLNPDDGETRKGKGCLTYGCGVGATLFLLLLIFGGRILYNSYQDFSARYLSDAPERLPEVVFSADQADEIRKRVAEFAAGLDGSEKSLDLTVDELNILMRSSPEARALSGILHFFAEQDTLKAKLSLNLGPLGMQGQYLNGDAALLLIADPNNPILRVSAVEVYTQRLPPRLTSMVQTVNFFAALNLTPTQQDVLRRLKEIKVSGKTVTLTFK